MAKGNSVQTLLIAALVVLGGVVQYILMAQAIKDLLGRPRVRGDNKILWGLLILCVPMIGALIYSWMGPTSFLQRSTSVPGKMAPPQSVSGFPAPERDHRMPPPANVTPIRAARSLRSRPLQANEAPSSHGHARDKNASSMPPWKTGS